VIHISLAPKCNAVIKAIGAAEADVRNGLIGTVPAHLPDAHYPGAGKVGHGNGYLYPHDFADGIVPQRYAPDPVAGRRYYEPSRHGLEARGTERSAPTRAILGQPGEGPGDRPGNRPGTKGKPGNTTDDKPGNDTGSTTEKEQA